VNEEIVIVVIGPAVVAILIEGRVVELRSDLGLVADGAGDDAVSALEGHLPAVSRPFLDFAEAARVVAAQRSSARGKRPRGAGHRRTGRIVLDVVDAGVLRPYLVEGVDVVVGAACVGMLLMEADERVDLEMSVEQRAVVT